MPYTCLIHLSDRTVPEVRFFASETREDLTFALGQTLHDWPNAARLEVYDEADGALLQVDGLQPPDFL